MAIGDHANVLGRLKTLLPGGWFPTGQTPVLDTVLSGPAAALSWAYGLISWTCQQMRLATSQGGMLDLFAYDYFGPALPRRPGESDASFISRIQGALLAPLGTRAAMAAALFRLTGNHPKIFEPFNPNDTGGYLNTANPAAPAIVGYGAAGAYGNVAMPAQCFITVYPSLQGSSAPVTGYGGNLGGYGSGAIEYLASAEETGVIQTLEIYNTINATKAAGVVCWTQIAP